MKTQIYKDEIISVYAHITDSSDRVLVTFGDMLVKSSSGNFFGESAVNKLKLNCIGFVAASENWYPESSIKKSMSYVESYLENKRITVYGASMGGYAAIKYSRLLGAETVISLCPQYSIDPVHGSFIGWTNYFTASMQGMDIKSSDVSGEVFIISDLTDKRESWHASRIQEQVKKCYFCNIPGVGHHVTPTLAGANKLNDILLAAQEKDCVSLQRVVANARRKSTYRIENVIRKTINKGWFAWPKGTPDELIERYGKVTLEFLAQMYLSTHLLETATPQNQHYILSLFKYPFSDKDGYSYMEKERRRNHRLIDHHGKVLTICPIRRVVISSAKKNSLPEVQLEILGKKAMLYFKVMGLKIYLSVDQSGSISPINWIGENTHPHFDIEFIDERVAFSLNGDYMSANPNGEVKLNRKKALAWEIFAISNFEISV